MKNKITVLVIVTIAYMFQLEKVMLSIYAIGYVLSLIALFKLTLWICAVRNVRGVDRNLTYEEFVKALKPIFIRALFWPKNAKEYLSVLLADCKTLYHWYN